MRGNGFSRPCGTEKKVRDVSRTPSCGLRPGLSSGRPFFGLDTEFHETLKAR